MGVIATYIYAVLGWKLIIEKHKYVLCHDITQFDCLTFALYVTPPFTFVILSVRD